MNKTTVYLPLETQRRLQEEALRVDRTQAAIIREAVERYLNTQERPALRSVGTLSKKSLTSSNQERWLQEHWGPEEPVTTPSTPPAR
jgi:hypothetical protein